LSLELWKMSKLPDIASCSALVRTPSEICQTDSYARLAVICLLSLFLL